MTVFIGYAGQVWMALYQALVLYQSTLATVTDSEQTVAISDAMLASLLNGASAIVAADTAQGWQAEFFNLETIAALPISVDPGTEAIFTARLQTYEAAWPALAAIVPQAPFGMPDTILAGTPVIPDCNLLGFYAAFAYETPPVGLTPGNFTANAQAVSTAFTTIAAAIDAFQGNNRTQAYDVATREALVTGSVANVVASLTSGPVAADLATTSAWNQIVTLPACITCARMLTGTPYSFQAQQSGVLRYLTLSLAHQIAAFLTVLARPDAAQPHVTTLRVNETLMDVAARTLDSFEQWTAIAALNGLSPPYVGPISAPGIAGWGTQLLLPNAGASTAATGEPPNYATDVLGTDIYVGPINGDMPMWTGDYQVITGNKNLAWALGRRLQTTLGTLIYHSGYGSRIPPEVGAVQDTATMSNTAAYGKSALASDPRVDSVLSATASGSNGLVAFKGVVQPIGFESQPLEINEVIASQRRA